MNGPEHIFEGLYDVTGYHVGPLDGRSDSRTVEMELVTENGKFRFAFTREGAHYLAEFLEFESKSTAPTEPPRMRLP